MLTVNDDFGCPWCDAPVAEEGDTCTFECMSAWFRYYTQVQPQELIGGNVRVLKLESLQPVPKSIQNQPWFQMWRM